jgi:hypothetical protein
MSDIANTVRPDFVPAGVQHLDGLLSPLEAYLDAVEARVAALQRQLTAVPLITAADAAAYAGVNVKRSCARSAVASSRSPAMSAVAPGSLACP